MPATMNLSLGESSITISSPGYDYETEIHLPIHIANKHPSGYSLWDDGTSFDYRTCNLSSWYLSTSDQVSLNSFLKTTARTEDATLTLGTSSGFYPFGPDKGDSGDFIVRITEQKQSGILQSPYKYFSNNVSMVMISSPAYSLPAQRSEGNFQIGLINGLMMPQDGFQVTTSYNNSTVLTRSGIAKSIDGYNSGDSYETEFTQQANSSNAGALINHFVNVVRSNDVTITAPTNYYVYGSDNSSSGAYTSKLLGSFYDENEMVIKIRHDNYNRFSIPLNFWKV